MVDGLITVRTKHLCEFLSIYANIFYQHILCTKFNQISEAVHKVTIVAKNKIKWILKFNSNITRDIGCMI